MAETVDQQSERKRAITARPASDITRLPANQHLTVADRQAERQQALLREVTTTLLITIVLFLGLRYSAQAVPLDGPSMQPGLHTDERVLVNSLAYVFRQPQRGDVIVFHPPSALTERYIKRVIGLPGDTVRLTLTEVYVNGIKLDEPYIAPVPYGIAENPEAESVHLGPDQFFVMGDNRTNSQDSRYFGPITQREIIGKAEFVVWPVNDAHDINSYGGVFVAIPSPNDP